MSRCGWISNGLRVALIGFISIGIGAVARAGSALTFSQIGSPLWQPVGDELFSAPIGTPADGFAGFEQSEKNILPSPNHEFLNGQIVPGTAHAPPYDGEITAGVTANGYKRGPTFTGDDFSNGNGVWAAFMGIPAAGASTGKTPDDASGPLVPNSIFPIVLSLGDTTRNGAEFDPAWSGSTPDVNGALGLPPGTFDGHSHLPFFFAEAFEFGPGGTPKSGKYESSWTLLDATGSGWKINTSYNVVPLPPAAWSAGSWLSIAIVLQCGKTFAAKRRAQRG